MRRLIALLAIVALLPLATIAQDGTPIADPPTAEPTATEISSPTDTPVPENTETPVSSETPIPTHTATATATATPLSGLPACSQALHDAYVTTGPDGNTYATWHPLVDTENDWPCSHRHEHGSNPAHVSPDWHPAFGYVASKHGMTEGHVGFKIAVIAGPNDQPLGILVHMGSASLLRVCVRFHTTEFAFLNNDGSLGAVIQFMGDYGRAVHNDTGTWLTPPSCPTQAADAKAAGSTGIRQFPGPGEPQGYEPWRPDTSKTVVGFVGSLSFNNRSAITTCNRIPECDETRWTGRTGSNRFFTKNTDSKGRTVGIQASTAKATGTFCTDPLARAVVDCGSPGAVVQFVTPGLVATWPCNSAHSTGGRGGAILVCGASDGHDINQTVNGVKAIPPGGPN